MNAPRFCLLIPLLRKQSDFCASRAGGMPRARSSSYWSSKPTRATAACTLGVPTPKRARGGGGGSFVRRPCAGPLRSLPPFCIQTPRGVSTPGTTDASRCGDDVAALRVCRNGGLCQAGKCACPPGWAGPSCTDFSCASRPCQHGGRCVGPPASCACAAGWHGGACSTARCGDGVATLGEQCDDGNVFGGDGCSPNCRLEPGAARVVSQDLVRARGEAPARARARAYRTTTSERCRGRGGAGRAW